MPAKASTSSRLLLAGGVAFAVTGWVPSCFMAPDVMGRQQVAGCQQLKDKVALQGLRKGCRYNSVCLRAVGLIFGTQSGNSEAIAGLIEDETGLEAINIDDIDVESLAEYDGLIIGTPTWNTGADEDRTGVGWDANRDAIKAMSLAGKPVAVFGLGDSGSYPDNFCEGLEEVHSTFKAAGAKMLGYVEPDGYSFEQSKSVVDGKFVGLPLDQDNEEDMSEERVKEWVAQLKAEGMPL